MTITFTIEGRALPKARPRFYKGKVYKPNKSKVYEEYVSWITKEHIATPSNLHCSIRIEFFYTVPPSFTKKKTQEALEGLWYPHCGDIDNLCKSILDGMNKVAYNDDAQVVELYAIKKYNHRDHTTITITFHEH